MKKILFLLTLSAAVACKKNDTVSTTNGPYNSPFDSLKPYYFEFDGEPVNGFSNIFYYTFTDNSNHDNVHVGLYREFGDTAFQLDMNTSNPPGQYHGNSSLIPPEADVSASAYVDGHQLKVIQSYLFLHYRSADSVSGIFSVSLMDTVNNTSHTVSNGSFAFAY